jgi:hypothetical protein
MPSAQIVKLNDENYFDWAELMEALLVKQDLWITIAGSRPAGSLNTKAVRDFVTKEQKARAELKLNVDPTQLPHTRFNTPKEIWENLERIHCGKGFASRLSLLRQFHRMEKADSQTMASWIAHVRELAHRITQIGFPLQDEEIIIVLTQGLGDLYDPLIVALDSTPPEELSVDYVVAHLINEETRRTTTNMVYGGGQNALAARMAQKKGKHIVCYGCGKKGHFVSDCPEDDKDSVEEHQAGYAELFAF